MDEKTKYVNKSDVKFGGLEKIDISALEKACHHDWSNQALCRVNDSVVRPGMKSMPVARSTFRPLSNKNRLGRCMLEMSLETVRTFLHEYFVSLLHVNEFGGDHERRPSV
jgi:hypothetical protein